MKHALITTTILTALAVTPALADDKVRDGALTGALLLGATGVLGDASTSSTIKRAVIGAAAGAAVGYGLEQKEKERARSTVTQSAPATQPVQASTTQAAPVQQVSTATLEDYTAQQDDLAIAMNGTGASVINNGDHILVNLPGGLTFESGSVDLNEDARATVARLAGSLNRYPNSLIDAIGHTDGSGPANANQALSARRAQAVTNVLTQYGVGYDRIRSYGRGEWEPIARNDTEYGKSLNRRVEILIYPQQ
ncbi:MAG: OmpA family protein [Pseudomonadota bacterium]